MKQTITITIDPEVKIKAQKRAKEELRSLSAHIEYLLIQDTKNNK